MQEAGRATLSLGQAQSPSELPHDSPAWFLGLCTIGWLRGLSTGPRELVYGSSVKTGWDHLPSH